MNRWLVLPLAVVSMLFADGTARAGDPTTADCLAASDASLGLRNEHKLREARASLLVCAAATCPADVRNECIRRVGEVNAAMPTIVFEAKDAAGNDLGAVKVIMDGQPLVDRLEGTALSIDPGEHTFTFEAPGQPLVRKQFVIRQAEKDRRERIVFGESPRPAVRPQETSPARVPPPGRARGLGTQRIVAVVVAGVGVIGVGVGAVLGLQAISKHDDAARACPDRCADQAGVDMWKDAGTLGNVSTAAFIVGAAGLAGGAALWFTARSSANAPRAEIGLGLGTLRVKGVW